MRLRFVTASVVLLLVAETSAFSHQAPQAPAARGAISGTVLDGTTGTAVADAIVGLSAQPGTELPAGYQARQVTDAKGRFVFQNLPEAGTFQLTAGKHGYLDGGYGRDTSPADPLRPIVIANGSWAGNLRVNIWRPGVISGSVRDESGEPVVGVFVRALGRIRIAGRDELAAGPITVTDDHGQYRISSLMPGRYFVQVPSVQMSVPGGTRISAAGGNVPEGAIDVDDTARLVIGRYPLPPRSLNGRAMAYATSFHPNGSTPAMASTIDLKFGDDRSGIDVSLTPVPAVRVSGTVEGPAEALATMTLRLLPAGMENLGLGAEAATSLVGPNGAFAFLNVPAGEYLLDAPVTFNEYAMSSGATLTGGFVGMRGTSLPPPPPRGSSGRSSQFIEGAPGVSFSTADFRGAGGNEVPAFTTRMAVTVGTSDLVGLSVRLRSNATMRGRLVLEQDPSKPAVQQPPRVSVFMDPAGGQPSLGKPISPMLGLAFEQAFYIPGIQPGEYFLRAQAGSGWLVKSIEWRGRDYSTTPFDAANTDELSGVVPTVTNAVPTLSGTVRTQDGSAPESSVVIVFPVQPAMRVNTGLWPTRMTSITPQANGAFRLTTLPAGDYLAAAINRSQLANWRDPEFLALVERHAARITLAWGQTVSQDLTTVVVR